MPLEDEELFVEPQADDQSGAHEPEAPEPDDDDLEITIEGEDAPAAAGHDSDLVRKLRAEIKERDQRLKTYEAPKPVEIGPKPTLESAEYDEDKFETQLLAWNQRKAKADEEVKAAQSQKEEANRSWQGELQAFERGKSALGAKDFDAAEETLVSTMNQVQQAVIIKAASTPEAAAKIVYALGRHPERLKALAAIQDPIKLAVAIAKLEGQITVNTRRAAPEPESRVRGSAPLSRTTDKALEKMEADAAKDPNYDRGKIRRYKAEQADKGKRK